jgi:hypothetical protein
MRELVPVVAAASLALAAAGVAQPSSGRKPLSASSPAIIIQIKMSVNAKFERAIDNPDIKVVSLYGTLKCRANAPRPSYLTIKIGRAAVFTGDRVRGVTCKPLNPKASRVGGSWSGEVVGKCSRKPAVARVFVSDDTKGGGDVKVTLKGSGAFCTVAVGQKDLLGSLTARMGQDVNE